MKTLQEQLYQEWRIANREWREKRKNWYSQLQATSYQLKAKIEQLENLTTLEIERLLNLEQQYNQRVETLKQLGILEEVTIYRQQANDTEPMIPEARLRIIGLNGKSYLLPTYKEIQGQLKKNPKHCQILVEKTKQGFSTLLIVPFAIPFNELKQILTRTNTLFHTWGKPYDNYDDSGKVINYPSTITYRGKTK